jgi:hypothetical protein
MTKVQATRSGVPLRVRVAIVRPQPSRMPRSGSQRGRIRLARRAVIIFLIAIIAANLGLSLGMDYVFPTVRDPEYGRRLSRLQSRMAEHPGRPVVLVLGSSRAAMGVRPEFMNDDPQGPIVFNFAIVGSGPVMEVMTLRRLLADGIRPDGIVLEYWPAFMREDGPYAEEIRIDKHRLLPQDRSFVRDYFADPTHVEAIMTDIRWVPWSSHRLRLVSQTVPGWLPYDRRQDGPWGKLDSWGWLPGFDSDLSPHERAARHANAAEYYVPLFAAFEITPIADRAFREVIETCRTHSIRMALAWLPESSEFRGWYTPQAMCVGEQYLEAMRAEYGFPLIDARDWVPDRHIADGFHLTQPGAEVLSRRLGSTIREIFPELRGRP